MAATAPPESRSAAPYGTTLHDESRTNRNLPKGSTSNAGHKRTVWIKRPVHRGEGLNDWLYRRAFHLAKEGATAQSAAAALHALVGEQAHTGEIRRQVERGFRAASVAGAVGYLPGRPAAPAWPLRDDDLLARLWEDHPATVDELAALSPCPAPDHPLDVLRALHGTDDALICLGAEPAGPFYTRTISEWRQRHESVERWEMTVPNPMRSAWGTTDEGKTSARCRDNSCGMGGQKFLVLEFDLPPHAAVIRELGAAAPDVCAALILRKFDLQKVRMVVFSGSKSLHLWLPAEGRTQDEINRFYRVWCRYGGDWRGSLPEQQFRLPGGYRRDKAAVQRVVYFDPEGAR